MAEFFIEYGLFALKAFTLVSLVVVAGAIVIGGFMRSSGREREHFEIVKLNDRAKEEQELLSEAMLDDLGHRQVQKDRTASLKKERKARKKELAASKKGDTTPPPLHPDRRRVFVLDFDGDIAATATTALRREVSAILALDQPADEVVVRLESGGGLVHSYGFASSQLARIKAKGIKLTICVDKIAASGGYMMACTADRLFAAPFAVIGSIGVVAQVPNFHRLLKKHDVDVELLTAGEHKRTLTVLGENTPEKRKKFQEDLELTHTLFKDFITTQRPGLAIDQVATGEVWLGTRAVEKNLVDELSTSDEYIAGLFDTSDVLELRFEKKKNLQDKLASSLETAADRVISRWWQRATDHTPTA